MAYRKIRVAAGGAVTLVVCAMAALGLPSPAGATPVGASPTAASSGYQFSARYLQLPTYPNGDAWGQCDATLPGLASNAPIVSVALTAHNAGCWMTGADGGIFTYGDAGYFGSMGGKPLAAPIVGMVPTADNHGYWEVASDGGAFTFGDAHFHGSMGGRPLAAPIVGMAADRVTGGYWLVAADGGVFSFDAPFYGSMGGKFLAAPVVGMTAATGGGGYLLAAADGGVFTFGDAVFHGSMAGKNLNAPVTAVASDPVTGGYWMVAADGGVFSFAAPFFGSAFTPIGPQPNPYVAIAASPDGGGYLLLPTDPPVEPAVGGFPLAQREWEYDTNLACYLEGPPLIQGAQYLLIGEHVDGGDTSGYPAAVAAFERLSFLPGMNRTPAQNAEAFADTAYLNAFFGTKGFVPCS